MFQKKLEQLFGARRRFARRAAARQSVLTFTQLEGREVPAVLLTAAAPTYSENFNVLSGTPSFNTVAFRNESPTAPESINAADAPAGTVPNWYVFQAESNQEPGFYIPADPTLLNGTPAGASYSFVSTPGAADRTLGSIGSNSVSNIHNAVAIRNNEAPGGKFLTSVTVGYTGEQWNKANAAAQTLRFAFSANAEGPYSQEALDFTEEPLLNFVTPQIGSGGGLDGNLAANRTVKGPVTINLDAINQAVAPGKTLWLRWTDRNDDGNDAAVGIDDISVTGTFSATAAAFQNKAAAFTGAYSQNFNTLSNTSTTAFAPYSTVDAGFTVVGQKQSINPDTYLVGTGTGNTGGLYSFGASGSTDRALGSVGSDNAVAGGFFTSVRLRNTTGSTVNAATVSYAGEQWRFGGNVDDKQRLQVQYSLTDGGLWVDVPSLDFVSPVVAHPNPVFPSTPPSTALALDGNLAGNRQVLTATLGGIGGGVFAAGAGKLNWQSGQELLIRWIDINDGGNDNALAIDDVSVRSLTTGGTAAEFSPVGVTTTATSINFDSLGNPTTAGANNPLPWAQGKTVAGVFSQFGNTGAAPVTYVVNDGGDNTGRVYSFGSDSLNNAERALGSIASNNNEAGYVLHGIALQNTSGVSQTDLAIAFTNEQWRRGENKNPEVLFFQISDDGGLTWKSPAGLSTTTKNPATVLGSDPVATGLDGNQSANRSTITPPLGGNVAGLDIAAGETFYVRWVDPNNIGTDHGVSVDSVEVQFV